MGPETKKRADVFFRFVDSDWKPLSIDVAPVTDAADSGDDGRLSSFACEAIECQVDAQDLHIDPSFSARQTSGINIRCIHNRHNKRKRIQKKWDKKYGATYSIWLDGPFEKTTAPDGTITYDQHHGALGLSFSKEEAWDAES